MCVGCVGTLGCCRPGAGGEEKGGVCTHPNAVVPRCFSQLHIWLHALHIHGLCGRGVGLVCVQTRSPRCTHVDLTSPYVSGPILTPDEMFFLPCLIGNQSLLPFRFGTPWFGSEGLGIRCLTWKENLGCFCCSYWRASGDSEPNKPDPEPRGSSHPQRVGKGGKKAIWGPGGLRSDPH